MSEDPNRLKLYIEKLRLIERMENPTTPEDVLLSLEMNKSRRERREEIKFTAEDMHNFVLKILEVFARSEGRDLATDKDNAKVIQLLSLYLAEDPDFERDGLSLKKGIWLFGKIGSGKTWMLRAMSGIYETLKLYDKRFRVITSDEIVNKFINSQKPESLELYSTGNWGFDDLGEEAKKVVMFTNEYFPMANVMSARYRYFTAAGIKTHVTSNLDPDGELLEFYGERLRSRFNQMFNFIYLGGKDRRK